MIDEGSYGRSDGKAYLAWFDDDDGEEGASVGQDGNLPLPQLEAAAKGEGDKTYYAVELAAKKFALEHGLELDPMRGWVTDSKKIFSKYKAAMDAALQLVDQPEMPPWVALALAAGWKMPKGWKP